MTGAVPPEQTAAERTTGAEELVRGLEAAGVRFMFGIPGEHCLEVVDAVDRSDSIRFISVRHEGAASFMAEAYGKFTGSMAACVGTASVGAVNMLPGVNVGHHDSTPMVAIAGQVVTGFRGRDAWQEVDLDDMFRTVSRHAEEVTHRATLGDAVTRTLAAATSDRPGPVFLAVPADVQEEVGDAQVLRPLGTSPSAMAPADVRRAADLLQAAERPVLVVGGGIGAAGAHEVLHAFASELDIPVLTTFRRGDSFPNDDPHYAGSLGLGAPAPVRKTVATADLIIAVGTRLSEVTTGGYSFPTATHRVIHVDPDGATLTNQPFAADLRVRADPREALEAMLAECRARHLPVRDRWWTAHTAIARELRAGLEVGSVAELVADIASVMDQLLPEDAVITSDAGYFFLNSSPYLRLSPQRRYLGPASGTMGYGVPAAIAAKLAAPERQVVAVCGDGGFMMSLQELETAVRYSVPVVVVIFNDNAYGSIVRTQQRRYGREVGTSLGNPPFDELARLFGGSGYQVDSADAFREAFAEAMTLQTFSVIEVSLRPEAPPAASHSTPPPHSLP